MMENRECHDCGSSIENCDGCGKEFKKGNRLLHLDTDDEPLHYHSKKCYIKNVVMPDWDYTKVL